MIETAFPLKGAVALVTGGASGIGAATSRALAAEGVRVVIADLQLDRGREVAASVDGLAVHLDVTDQAAAVASLDAATREFGPVDILVNNAGGGHVAMFVDTEPTSWDHVLRTNLVGVLTSTHAVLPGMIERRRGVVVNVSSEAARMGAVGGAVYAAAKAGILGFTRAIAREVSRFGIRVNAVAPGPVDTPMLNGAAAASGAFGMAVRDGMVDATLFGRPATPDEVADAIVFLASDRAAFITGHTLSVSGGAVMA